MARPRSVLPDHHPKQHLRAVRGGPILLQRDLRRVGDHQQRGLSGHAISRPCEHLGSSPVGLGPIVYAGDIPLSIPLSFATMGTSRSGGRLFTIIQFVGVEHAVVTFDCLLAAALRAFGTPGHVHRPQLPSMETPQRPTLPKRLERLRLCEKRRGPSVHPTRPILWC